MRSAKTDRSPSSCLLLRVSTCGDMDSSLAAAAEDEADAGLELLRTS